jgi:hypothetical protein
MKNKKRTRREFIKTSASAAIGGAFYLSCSRRASAKVSKQKARVILVRHKDVLDKQHKPNPEILGKMLDQAVTRLLDQKDPVNAWKKLVKPSDIVGIKTNVWSFLRTPESLEQAIKRRAMDAGVKEKNIGISDREVLDLAVFKKATALINVRPLRTHYWSGVGSCIKNYIMFSDSPSSYHPDKCADLAKLFELPQVKGKSRLHILVMLTPLFEGSGPHHFNPKYLWPYRGMLVGTDPVAVDATGLRILEARRKAFFKEERPFSASPKHIMLADTRHHLGISDPAKIELVKLGWDKDILI